MTISLVCLATHYFSLACIEELVSAKGEPIELRIWKSRRPHYHATTINEDTRDNKMLSTAALCLVRIKLLLLLLVEFNETEPLVSRAGQVVWSHNLPLVSPLSRSLSPLPTILKCERNPSCVAIFRLVPNLIESIIRPHYNSSVFASRQPPCWLKKEREREREFILGGPFMAKAAAAATLPACRLTQFKIIRQLSTFWRKSNLRYF